MATMSRLFIKKIISEMIAHARREAPIEACGIIAGKDGVAEKYYEMANTDKSDEHYLMDPEEQFKIMKVIRGLGLEILGIFHSHTKTPARPSKEDIRFAFTEDVVYLITSLMETERPVTNGFIIEEGNITEVPVEVGEMP